MEELDESLDQYPGLNIDYLSVQLLLFHNKYPCSSSGEAAEVLRRLPVEVRGLVFSVLEPLHILRQGFEWSSGTSTPSILYVKLLESLCC